MSDFHEFYAQINPNGKEYVIYYEIYLDSI